MRERLSWIGAIPHVVITLLMILVAGRGSGTQQQVQTRGAG